MTNNSFTFKPCPHCGGKAVSIADRFVEPGKQEFAGMCYDCFAQTAWVSTREKAVELWNNRPDEDKNVKIHGVYRHFKGKLYIVEDVILHSETNEKMVLYRALYGNNQLWCRPYDMFISEVDHEKYSNVKQKHRFELYEDPPQDNCDESKRWHLCSFDCTQTLIADDWEYCPWCGEKLEKEGE